MRAALEGALLAWTALVMLAPSNVQSERAWSRPVVLTACSAQGAPAVLFPADGPRHRTGEGAIVWGSAQRCPGRAGPRLATIAARTDLPSAPVTPLAALAGGAHRLRPSGVVFADTAPHGHILLAAATALFDPAGEISAGGEETRRGALADTGAAEAARARSEGGGGSGGLVLSEGPAYGPFSSPVSTGGAPMPLALGTAYLGDVALVSPGGAGNEAQASAQSDEVELRMHRWYAQTMQVTPPTAVTPSRGVEGLTVTMDYRSDALVVWERDETIYARDMLQSSRSSGTVARVARAAPEARIAAMRSDDNRAILAWSETRHGVTCVYAEISGTGIVFGRPRLLERFADPGKAAPPPGSVRLVRLLSESVMLGWTGAASGHWVVRTAAVDLDGVRSIDTISAPGRGALLRDLAPGPDGEAYALWSEPAAAGSGAPGEGTGQALYAARGIDAYPGHTIFGVPEPITAAGSSGSTGEATLAVDPDTDRALAAWRTPGGGVAYSLRGLGGT